MIGISSNHRPKRNLDPKAWFILNLLSSHLLPNQRLFGELFGISNVFPSTFLKRIAMYCCLMSQPKFNKYFTDVCVWVNIYFAFIGFYFKGYAHADVMCGIIVYNECVKTVYLRILHTCDPSTFEIFWFT